MSFAVPTMVSAVLAIVVGLLLSTFIAPEGTFWKGANEAVNLADEYIDIGVDTLDAEAPSVPRADLAAIENLISSIEKTKGNKFCFTKLTSMPSFQEKGTSLLVEFDGKDITKPKKGSTTFSVYGGVEGLQKITSFEIEDIAPCVIQGNDAARNFKDIFVDGQLELDSDGNIITKIDRDNNYASDFSTYYSPIYSFSIAGNDDGSNNILFEGKKFDFEDTWLFTPDGETMCFFPKISNLGFQECGQRHGALNENCFDENREDKVSIPGQVGGNKGVARYCIN